MGVYGSCYRGSVIVTYSRSSSHRGSIVISCHWGSMCNSYWSSCNWSSMGNCNMSSMGMCKSNRSNVMRHSNRSNLMSNSNRSSCLAYRIHKPILVQILGESFQSNGCQAPGCLHKVPIGRGERAGLRTLVHKTKVREGGSTRYQTGQDSL